MRMTMIVLLGCLLSASANGESLWNKRHPDQAFLFLDSRARNVGDLLTVIIMQDTDANHREDRQMNKTTGVNSGFDFESEAGGGFGQQGANAKLDVSNSSGRTFDGGSSFRSTQAFTDRMSATVIDVLPNGNLVISGQRRTRISGEERSLLLSGVVRAIDIGPDNTIGSRYISDFELEYESVGPGQRFSRQGWLGRAANAIWPF